jgi:hypothetical protein
MVDGGLHLELMVHVDSERDGIRGETSFKTTSGQAWDSIG